MQTASENGRPPNNTINQDSAGLKFILYTDQEMTSARNGINAHAQYSFGSNELLLPNLNAFAQCTLSVHFTWNASCFQSVCSSSPSYWQQSPALRHTQLLSCRNHIMISGLKLSVILTPRVLENTKRSWPITGDIYKCQDYLSSEGIQTSIRPSQTSQLERATSFLLISTYIISREEEYLRSLWSQNWTRYFPPCMIIEISPSCSQKFRTRHEPRGGAWKTRHLHPPFRVFYENVKKI